MTLNLEQAYFGRGADGYGILGASPGARPFAARVEALCGGVGTPDGTYGGDPILVSQPIGDRIVLLCGRSGPLDSVGRSTLFFHALVATKKDLLAAKADAFSLFDQGAFATKMALGGTEPLQLDVKSGRDGSTSRPDGGRTENASLPCVIRSDKPAHDAVRAFVGARSLDLSWATFSFQALSGFDVQALPHRATIPARFTEYDDFGRLIRPASSHPATAPSKSEPMTFASQNRMAKQPPTQVDSKHSATLKLSIVVNVVLAAACVLLFACRKSETPKPPSLLEDIQVETNRPAIAMQDEKRKIETLEELQVETNRLAIALQDEKRKIATLEASLSVVSDAEREKIAETARAEILARVPVNDITVCLEALVGKKDEKQRIKLWLDTIPTTNENERTQQ